jgi:hypothetical protein
VCRLGPDKRDEPKLGRPNDAEVDKAISFVEKLWRHSIEMGGNMQKDIKRKNWRAEGLQSAKQP